MYRSKKFNKNDIYILAVENVGSTYQLTVQFFDRFQLLLSPKVEKIIVTEENWECLS
jgi:hypothetical protein